MNFSSLTYGSSVKPFGCASMLQHGSKQFKRYIAMMNILIFTFCMQFSSFTLIQQRNFLNFKQHLRQLNFHCFKKQIFTFGNHLFMVCFTFHIYVSLSLISSSHPQNQTKKRNSSNFPCQSPNFGALFCKILHISYN